MTTSQVLIGMGKRTTLDSTQYKSKLVNRLIEHTPKLSDNYLIQLNKLIPVIKNGIFQPSEDF